MNRAIFVDRDGTLIEEVNFLSKPSQVRWIPGVLERLAQLLERPLIIDGRNIFEPQRLAALNFQYFSVGRAPAAPIAQATTDRDR